MREHCYGSISEENSTHHSNSCYGYNSYRNPTELKKNLKCLIEYYFLHFLLEVQNYFHERSYVFLLRQNNYPTLCWMTATLFPPCHTLFLISSTNIPAHTDHHRNQDQGGLLIPGNICPTHILNMWVQLVEIEHL